MSQFSAHILTLFPDMFPGPLAEGVTGRGLREGLWSLQATNIRDFAENNYKTVDDTPFGGGAGMVLKPDILSKAIESIENRGRMIFMSPRGRPFTQSIAADLSVTPNVTILCGRYEGVDQRVLDAYDIEELSIGDYVLSNGELAAMTVLDASVRLIPGVVGNDETVGRESFQNGLIEHDHYTKPRSWQTPNGDTLDIPEVLASGHHKKIEEWRQKSSESNTQNSRPDLWQEYIQGKNT